MSRDRVGSETLVRSASWTRCATFLAAMCSLSLPISRSAGAQSLPVDSTIGILSMTPIERAAIRDATAQVVRALEQREAAWLRAAYGLRPGVGARAWLAVSRARAAGARPTVEEVSEPTLLDRGDVARFSISLRLRWVSPIGRAQSALLRVTASCVQEGTRCTVLDLETHDQL